MDVLFILFGVIVHFLVLMYLFKFIFGKIISAKRINIFTAFCVVVFVGLLSYGYITSDPPGYCEAQNRYIPDEVFIKASESLLNEAISSDRQPWGRYPEIVEGKKLSAMDRQRLEESMKQQNFKVIRDGRTFKGWLLGYDAHHHWTQVQLYESSGKYILDFVYDACGARVPDNERG